MPDFTRPAPTFETVTSAAWIIVPKTGLVLKPRAYATQEAALDAYRTLEGYYAPEASTLEQQSLRPIYGGGTLIENLWAEMDAIMERLMTGQQAEDGGDRFRAEELAWVLAIVTNAYDPSVDRIRAETMERWNAAQLEADLQEEALDPDQPEDPTERWEENERRSASNHEGLS